MKNLINTNQKIHYNVLETELNMTSCILCNEISLEFYDFDKKVFHCKKCGVLFSKNTSETYPSIITKKNQPIKKFKIIMQKRLSKLIAKNYLEFLKDRTDMKFQTALDIGSGFGDFAYELSKLGIDVTGIESDKDTVNNSIFRNIKLDKFNTNYKSSTKFDLIILNQVLYYFPNSIDVLKKVKLMLNDNGLIFIVTVNPDSTFRWKFRIWTQGCKICMSKKNFESLTSIGLTVVNYVSYDDRIYIDYVLKRKSDFSVLYWVNILLYLAGIKKITIPKENGIHNFIILKNSQIT